MSDIETWVECKKPCADCPERTARTAKLRCQHPWRLIIDTLVDNSENLSPEVLAECIKDGATVSTGYLDTGLRPSLQLYSQQPASKHHFNQVKVI